MVSLAGLVRLVSQGVGKDGGVGKFDRLGKVGVGKVGDAGDW